MKLFNSMPGFATIPTVFALTVMILVVVLGTVTLTSTENFSMVAQTHSLQALRYAETGAKDALMLITRNKKYTCAAVDCYSLDMTTDGCSSGEACVTVSVSAGLGTSGNPKVITAEGVSGDYRRRLQVEVVYDASQHGEISTATWTELTD